MQTGERDERTHQRLLHEIVGLPRAAREVAAVAVQVRPQGLESFEEIAPGCRDCGGEVVDGGHWGRRASHERVTRGRAKRIAATGGQSDTRYPARLGSCLPHMRRRPASHRYAVDLPAEAMDVLRWHVDTQLRTPDQKESDLLFPAVNGKFRSPSVLNKPLAEVAQELGLGKKITQRALRRTFNDLARAAQVSDLVTRSISGHLTERMQHHYSTVNAGEQREALAKVIRLFAPDAARPYMERSGEESGEGAPSSGEERAWCIGCLGRRCEGRPNMATTWRSLEPFLDETTLGPGRD